MIVPDARQTPVSRLVVRALEQAVRVRSGRAPEFVERLRRVDRETTVVADELLNTVKQARGRTVRARRHSRARRHTRCHYLGVSAAARYRSSDSTSAASATVSAISCRKRSR